MPPAPGKALVLARPQKTWVLSESQIRSDQVRSRACAAIIENIAAKSQQGGEKWLGMIFTGVSDINLPSTPIVG